MYLFMRNPIDRILKLSLFAYGWTNIGIFDQCFALITLRVIMP